jgi:hypothetical protein
MENEAVRFESVGDEATQLGAVDFIVKDLQLNSTCVSPPAGGAGARTTWATSTHGPGHGVNQAGFMVRLRLDARGAGRNGDYSTNRDDSNVSHLHARQRAIASAIADARRRIPG